MSFQSIESVSLTRQVNRGVTVEKCTDACELRSADIHEGGRPEAPTKFSHREVAGRRQATLIVSNEHRISDDAQPWISGVRWGDRAVSIEISTHKMMDHGRWEIREGQSLALVRPNVTISQGPSKFMARNVNANRLMPPVYPEHGMGRFKSATEGHDVCRVALGQRQCQDTGYTSSSSPGDGSVGSKKTEPVALGLCVDRIEEPVITPIASQLRSGPARIATPMQYAHDGRGRDTETDADLCERPSAQVEGRYGLPLLWAESPCSLNHVNNHNTGIG